MTPLHVLRAQQIDPSGWFDNIPQIITAIGGGVVIREVVRQIFARANKQDDNAVIARTDLRQQVADLIARVDAMQVRLDATNERANALFAENAELRAENRGLRQRYHALMNWLAEQENLPTPPPWLYQPIEGPTARDAAPKPPETKS
jgi:hypothetical protein